VLDLLRRCAMTSAVRPVSSRRAPRESAIRFSCHAGRSFVQNQEARIVRKSAREVDELALANGKRRAPLVDDGVRSAVSE